MQNIDKRVLYLLMILCVSVPLIVRPSRHPKVIFSEVKNAYSVINSVPKGKFVLISSVWGPGTEAENKPQMEAIVRNLFMNGTKFGVVSFDQAGTEITFRLVKKLSDEYGKKYGDDWVHFGFRPPSSSLMQTMMRGMSTDFAGSIGKDINGNSPGKLAATKSIKSAKDVGAVVEVTPSATVDLWISYFTGPNRIPLVYCPTAVLAAGSYPYLDTGQIDGMLNGVVGAAQYETLIGMANVATDASATAWALSSAHIAIIVLIVIGNIGYIITKRAGGRTNG